MSLVNLILLSSTPIVGLGVLLGIGRFEKYVLDESPAHDASALVDGDLSTAQVQAEPVHRAAA
ncbi:MAG TPA: hypothetical protein VNF71_11250 [Acidimicrobiales bacterium]|nr:hypothetical protein [Acidimicrobiales bacterium]